ncbi:sphingomyelin phosphodiesterase 4-like [Halichondria panicea]|uniref:sphingomyelin phosphodiesterase 4-like n=1 Tax=Halichondria panicea TaxID=6063 RepID=UPI00312B5136
MLSALQANVGGSTSSSPDPYSGLHHPRISLRCSHVASSISSLPIKELHQFFPRLLSNIFGFDHSPGWALLQFNKMQHGDFHQLLQFMAPHGELFGLIRKLDTEGFIYEFPVECLPRPSQCALSEGTIPSFYCSKVQLSLSVDNSPTHIFLSAFEYYIFHFAYYLIHCQTYPSRSPPAQNFANCLFVSLFDCYLSHFLPYTGIVPPSPTNSLSQGHSLYTRSPRLSTSFGSPVGQSPSYGATSPMRRGAKICIGSPKQSPQVTQSETFVQVLVEFWLNQNSYNGGRGDLLAQAQNQFTPSEEHMILLRRLLKQVHYFGCGYSYSATSPTTHSLLIPVTDNLRSSLVPLYVQKRLFHFLNYSFKHSPLDSNLRYILELWLTFIQPWRYIDPTKLSTDNKGSFGSLPKRWRSFVLDNLPFYTNLLVEFLGRFFQADLTHDPNITLLYRATKVFALPELMGFIRHGEALLLDFAHNSSRGNSPSSASSIKAVFVDCVGPSFDHTPLFGQDTQDAIHSLLYKVCRSQLLLSSQSSSSSSSQPFTSIPSESFMSLSASTPPPPHKSLFKQLWDSLVDVFSYDYPSPSVSPIIDPEKLINMLDSIAQNLSATFELPIPRDTSLNDSVLGIDASFESSLIGLTSTSSPPPSLEPEFIQGSSRLSPQGKVQVIQGLRKCSGRNVHYRGDPLLQPIRSYENATLVRTLYRVSSLLNEKYSEQLAAVGSGGGLLHHLFLQLLSPPPPHLHATLFPQYSSEPPVTPVHRVTPVISYLDDEEPLPPVPRINLRPLASYYTLTYIVLALAFVWLFSLPSLYCLLGLCCFVFVYCVISYCIHGTVKKH